MTLLDRLLDKISPEPNTGCWLWTAALDRKGYGTIKTGSLTDGTRMTYRAHRVCYTLLVGDIPGDLELDHKCRVRCCVNPAHLEPVTTRINLLRGNTITANNASKTHCPFGHNLAEAYRYQHRSGSVYRQCRECRRKGGRNKPQGEVA